MRAPESGKTDESGQEEVLYDSPRTRVVRLPQPGGADTVVRKQPLGPDAANRLRNELSALRKLDGVDGTPRLLTDHPLDGALTFADAPTRTLAALPTPWQLAPLLDLAHGLAGTLAAVHRHGLVHRDVNPANILIPLIGTQLALQQPPILIDFELATAFAEDRSAEVQEHGLAGTLPYLAPEQTGRTGRPVDHRADLYSLGATLYELATGSPPFGRDGDPLRLVHDHLARVPVPPAEVNPEIPARLSDVIVRLLCKEPAQRYQSGEGLAYDIARVRDAYARGEAADFALGQRDFALRLAAPARLVGRDAASASLHQLFGEAISGDRGVALVTGPPGVGKTALIDHLRPTVATAGGRFVAGKFDQYRRDFGSDAVLQVFCALGAQLLAEPDHEVALLRDRLLATLGANAGLAAAVLPPLAALLGVAPEEVTDDPHRVTRIRQVTLDLLRAVASHERPVVIFVDDLQWAGPAAFGFLDAVLDSPDLPGVLVLGAFREADVDEAHPLTAVLARLRRTGGNTMELRLANLPPGDLSALLAQMLRVPVDEATSLAEVLATRTGGNPFDTVELLNALRREGALVPVGHGWQWDPATLRQFVGRGDVVDLLAARIEELPAGARDLLEVLACLGGDIEIELLALAAGRPAAEIDTALLAAAADGLVVVGPAGNATVSFRHDRVQQAAYARLAPADLAALHLAVARRLTAEPDFALAAAQQYFAALDGVTEPAERRTVADLLCTAATAARLVTNHSAAEAFLAAAIQLFESTDPDYLQAQSQWHAALCNLGRLVEADQVYQELDQAESDPVRHADATCAQIASLANRGLLREACELGSGLLGRLGVVVPAPGEMGPGIGAGLDSLYEWLADGDEADDLRRPEITDPRLAATARLINRMLMPAFMSDRVLLAWLVLRAGQLWAEHGPAPALVGPFGHAAFVTIPIRGDYRAGYQAVRRVIAVSEARGYEPDTSQARFLHALGTLAWSEPLENAVRTAHQARDGLLRGGDLQNAASTFYATLPPMLDGAADLNTVAAEAQDALALCGRIGYNHAAAAFVAYRQFVRAMHGDTAANGGFTDDEFDEEAHLAAQAHNPPGTLNLHVARAISAAVFADDEALDRHVRGILLALPTAPAIYLNAMGHLLSALSAARRARHASGEQQAAALAELDNSRDFLAARAADQPGNFRHMIHLIDAERAWATGDFAGAAAEFDAAAREAAGAGRQWQAALAAERAGLFFLEYGLEHVGRQLLAESFQRYGTWGAHAKTRLMEREHPFLTATREKSGRVATLGSTQSVNVSTHMIDLLAVLEASRALSSETDLGRLRQRVAEVLSAMTGATAVHLVLWDDQSGGWVLPGDDEQEALDLAEAAERGLLPMTALRYAERTREPMVIDDVSRDDRVVRDPYLAGIEHGSLLVVPVLSQGVPRAILILENRLTRSAFSVGRLDAVLLIAGQLTVSIDNALVYASLERKVAERTEELAAANHQLELLSVTDPLTGLANRRRLTDWLDAEWRRGLRSGEPIGLAMIDIDHFKKYNDHYGHQGGDECLRLVAQAVQACVRTTDLVARYGGEEFCIVMPGTDSIGALRVAQRACEAVAGLRAPHATADTGIVTISVGVTSAPPIVGGVPDQLIKIADEVLYEAKRAGRNRVASSTDR